MAGRLRASPPVLVGCHLLKAVEGWTDLGVTGMQSPEVRIYTAIIRDHLRRNRQMALVNGARQVGKTTVCRAAGDVYLNWDNADHQRTIQRGPNYEVHPKDGRGSSPDVIPDPGAHQHGLVIPAGDAKSARFVNTKSRSVVLEDAQVYVGQPKGVMGLGQ